MDIYKITNSVNGKIYIGKANNYIYRFNDHKSKALKGSNGCLHLYAAMRKYGVDNFICEKIDESFIEEELCEKEIYWIEKLNTRDNIIGYNIASGGTGGDTWSGHTNEEKAMISEKLSIANSGENNPMFGKNAFECKTEAEMILIKARMSESAKHRPEISSDTRQKLRDSKLGDNNPMKKLTGELHPTYNKLLYNNCREQHWYIEDNQPDGYILGGLNQVRSNSRAIEIVYDNHKYTFESITLAWQWLHRTFNFFEQASKKKYLKLIHLLLGDIESYAFRTIRNTENLDKLKVRYI